MASLVTVTTAAVVAVVVDAFPVELLTDPLDAQAVRQATRRAAVSWVAGGRGRESTRVAR
jgi:hypothetical protein